METPRINAERIKKYLSENARFDGRKKDEFREIEIETAVSNKAEGSARVKIGKTEVIVGVKMATSEPYPDSPDQGSLMVSAELLPLSSPRIELGPPKFDSIEIGRIIDRVVRESHFIDFSKLCIKEGEKVWTVFVDIYSINDDGNLLDAAGIGTLVALMNAKIPKYDEKEEKVLFGEWTDKKLPLAKEIPISITAYKVGENLIVDPTREEEDVCEGRVTMGYSNGRIHSLQKGDWAKIKTEEFSEALDLVEKSWKELNQKIQKALKI